MLNNPEGLATGTALNRDDAIVRAMRELLEREMEKERRAQNWHSVDRLIALYEEIGGTTINE